MPGMKSLYHGHSSWLSPGAARWNNLDQDFDSRCPNEIGKYYVSGFTNYYMVFFIMTNVSTGARYNFQTPANSKQVANVLQLALAVKAIPPYLTD
jgi:hypothetical protein